MRRGLPLLLLLGACVSPEPDIKGGEASDSTGGDDSDSAGDTTAPTVQWTSPTDAEPVYGDVALVVDAQDDREVVSVEFFVDGASLGADTSSPWSSTWSATVAGAHTLSAIAADAAGNVAQAEIGVVVDTPADDPPLVSFTAPADGAYLDGTVEATVDASDDDQVDTVRFTVDGALVSLDGVEPWSASIATDALAEGAHTIAAEAVDSGANTATASIVVTVDHDAPTVGIATPTDAAFLAGTVTLSATASDSVSLAGVEWSVDGVVIDSCSISPCEVDWDTTVEAFGTHSLAARAWDSAGHEATDLVVVDVVGPPEVSFVAPLEGDTVGGSAVVTVAATADAGIDEVRLAVDGATPLSDVLSPYAWSVDTCGLDDGEHTLDAEAVDAAGQSASASITVTVDQPLTVEIAAPTEGLVSGIVDLEGWVGGGGGVDVVWEVDGVALPSVDVGPASACTDPCGCEAWTAAWDSSPLPSGSHVLAATASDDSGATASASVTVWIDADADDDGHDDASRGGDDCDDADASSWPGAPEGCDGIDNDCDGTVDDEDDADGDGYSTSDCTTDADCDDEDAAIHPDADEVCDGIDNDCDAYTDTIPEHTAVEIHGGDLDHDFSYASYFLANAYVAGSDGTLEDFSVYLDPTGTLAVTFVVYESAEVGEPYARVAEQEADITGGTGWYGTTRLALPLVAGHRYVVGVHADAGLDGASWGYASGTAATMECQGYYQETTDPTLPETVDDTPSSTTYCLRDQLSLDLTADVDPDADLDGYNALCGDCDDDDASALPGGTEVCDAADNDCNGAVDDTTDPDGDGSFACDDCNEADPAIHPGAVEACGDGLDNDCDGGIDATAEYEATLAFDALGTYSVNLADSIGGNVYTFARPYTLESFSAKVGGISGTDEFWLGVYDGAGALLAAATVTASADGYIDSGPLDVSFAAGDTAYIGIASSGGALLLGNYGYPNLDAQDGVEPIACFQDRGSATPTSVDLPASTCLFPQTLTLRGLAEVDLDQDADGYTPTCGDCDDADAGIAPGAVEACNGVDDDCSGVVDDDVDDDGDGVYACSDCDDVEPAAYPGAPEVCDAIDNDCDGIIDDSGEVLVETVTFGAGSGGTYSDATSEAGNAFTATDDGVINSVSMYLDPQSSGSATFKVYHLSSSSWVLVGSKAASLSSFAGWYSSGTMDVPFTAGERYRLAVALPVYVNWYYGSGTGAAGGLSGAEGYYQLPSTSHTYTGKAVYQTVNVTRDDSESVDEDGDGFVALCGDCAEGDAAVSPAAVEACNEVDDDCDGAVDDVADADADGYDFCSDCDDANAAVHPDAIETCDGVDNDCDAAVDDDPEDGDTRWRDADGDGHGDASISIALCADTPGWVADRGDCDDADAAIHPGATEVCNAEDDDCDGSVDDGFDADADGYSAAALCGSIGDDCDDADDDVHPDALELCDGVDNDCDGAVDVATAPVATSTTWGTGTTSSSSSGSRGNVFYADSYVELDDFSFYLSLSTTRTVSTTVYEADSSAGPWTLLASTTSTLSAGSGWRSSGDLGLRLDAGHYYLLAHTTSGSVTGYDAGTASSAAGLSFVGTASNASTDPTVGVYTFASTTRPFYMKTSSAVLSLDDVDVDGDGETVFCGDCDDADDTAWTGAEEVCDGLDDDCDGLVDEADDRDADGVGACDDCDDDDATVHPGATDACYDGVDADCDGASDYDCDADGADDLAWGGLDCDDDDASSYPGASDLCRDGIDQDCDGADYTGCPSTGVEEIEPGDLVINEIMKDPAVVSDDAGEWFEVANRRGEDVDLRGLVVSDASGESFTVATDLTLSSGGFVVFGVGALPTATDGVAPDYVYDYSSFKLGNGADLITLGTATTTFDTVSWNDTDFPDTTGASLSLDPGLSDATLNDDGAAWCAATVRYGVDNAGSPGATNEACP